jgi:hypothetical protein
MANDNYRKWEPIPDSPGELYFYELHNESGQLNLLLKAFSSEDKTLRITFNGILTYRVALDSVRMKTVNDNFPMNTFGISTSSTFLEWFKEDSCGMFDDLSLMHIAICNTDNIVDVITNEYPAIEWI